MKARWLLLALILAGALYLDWTEPNEGREPFDSATVMGGPGCPALECESTDGYGYPVDMSGYVK